MPLMLEIVTPRGIAYSAQDLDRIVLRREEEKFEVGSELVILPRHGEMLVRLPFYEIRVARGQRFTDIDVDGGVAEVFNDTVTILTRDARVGPTKTVGCAPEQENP